MNYLGLVVAGLFRKKSRTILTLLSIITAFVLFGFLDGVRTVFTQGISTAGLSRLVVASKYSIIQGLPYSYRAQIERLDGVERVAAEVWFGGIYQDPKNFFATIATTPEDYLAMYPEIAMPEAQKKTFVSTRTGAIIGQPLARKFNFKVGDKIPLTSTIWPDKSDNTTWTFDLVGIFHAVNEEGERYENQLLFHYDYLDEGRLYGAGTVGWYVVQIADPARSSEIAQKIDKLFANSDSETRTQSAKEFNLSFAKQFGDIGLIVSGIMCAVFFTILLLTGNTMSQGVRERISEFAVMKTIGFSNESVLSLVMAESILLNVLGGVIGLGLAAMLLPAITSHFPLDIPHLHVDPESWMLGLAIMVGLGIAVGLAPALRAMRLRIVDALAER